ncbi:peptidoglycan-binding protein [Collinsella sp. zg1085]|uniref:peptidoglycan-binding domain-containing protein n=1 Tax=Collinsella sp. zg1085 TaxID=2844380 RepID=UPI001C0C91D1|nr:peptidoglycan-binding protein [Collinsella sp. zg1085]QWT17733.1 peptidoglycan-binding protein [Collinsella sp. zg1085]
MEPIVVGMTGPAVEDVQTRLVGLGFSIDKRELEEQSFGASTASAVRSFRAEQGLPELEDIDMPAWSMLVDASYKLGDRTLYLRLPNFHGADVAELQQALNTLGFACGVVDGYFGPHTEAALQEFQENVGLFADGMAFQDTFSYIARLRHVWDGKPSVVEAVTHARMGLARAASVLEQVRVAVGGEDPISRNVASRMWNIASATTINSGMVLFNGTAPEDVDFIIDIASRSLPDDAEPQATIVLSEVSNLAQRIQTAYAAAKVPPARLRLEISGMANSGSFTANDAQMLALKLLDGVCDALSA